jgi:hypothetical protein
MQRHLGTCLDCCHAAIEFEHDTIERWNASGAVLGKLQFSSALALIDPGRHPSARETLLALDEPRYLHQVTGLLGDRRLRVDDLPDLRRALSRESSARMADSGGKPRGASDDSSASDWERCREWRCHFHVPVDLQRVSDGPASERNDAAALTTTRAEADRILSRVLALEAWRPPELHVEIETYTWDVLPGPARGAGSLVDGLGREYAHVIGELERAGWRRE